MFLVGDVRAPSEIRAAARAGAIQGLPLIAADLIRRSHPAPAARFIEIDPAAPPLAPGLRLAADPDQITASAWLDLTEGPVVLSTPELRGRHADLTLFDAWGRRLGSAGSRAWGGMGRDIAIVGPEWRGELACGPLAIRAPSQAVWAVLHLWSHGAADRGATRELLFRFFVTPLLHPTERADGDPTDRLAPDAPLRDRLRRMPGAVFLHRLAGLLPSARAPFERADAIAGMERLGVRAGRPFDSRAWPEEWRAALDDGVADASAAFEPMPRPSAGWVDESEAFGAPPRADLMTLTARADSEGRPLCGGRRYRLTFAPGQTPPAEAFWTLDVLDAAGAPVRDLPGPGMAGDRRALVWEDDMALDLRIQNRRPLRGATNWLAIPENGLSLRLQIHWPLRRALEGRWTPPALVDVGPARTTGTVFAPRRPAAIPIPAPLQGGLQ